MDKSIKISGEILSRYEEIVSEKSIQFLKEIHERFNGKRLDLLNERKKSIVSITQINYLHIYVINVKIAKRN